MIFTTINRVRNKIVAKKINRGIFLLIRRLKMVGEMIGLMVWKVAWVGQRVEIS